MQRRSFNNRINGTFETGIVAHAYGRVDSSGSVILPFSFYGFLSYIYKDVKRALTFAEYEKAQRTATDKVNQMCKGVLTGQSSSENFNVDGGKLAPMFISGPSTSAHHLIFSCVNQGASYSLEIL